MGRRKFLKRTGGATAAAFIGMAAITNVRASTEPAESESFLILAVFA